MIPAENKVELEKPAYYHFIHFGQRPSNVLLCSLCQVEIAYHSIATALYEHLAKSSSDALSRLQ